jgi:hypothetical protein
MSSVRAEGQLDCTLQKLHRPLEPAIGQRKSKARFGELAVRMRRPDAIVHGVGRIVRNRRPSGLQPQDRYALALASECVIVWKPSESGASPVVKVPHHTAPGRFDPISEIDQSHVRLAAPAQVLSVDSSSQATKWTAPKPVRGRPGW